MVNLAPLEKIAIQAATTQARPDWNELYLLSHPESKAATVGSIASRWKNSARVQQYFQEINEQQETRIKKRIAAAIEEDRRSNEPKQPERARDVSGLIDYSDPAQQRRKLNELVNTAEDTKEALDALKTIIATQKDDRDAARERKQVTTYLPVRCNSCPLYQERKKSL